MRLEKILNSQHSHFLLHSLFKVNKLLILNGKKQIKSTTVK